jgi:hypothetical protein
MRKFSLPLGVAMGFSLAFVCHAIAKPATTKDLAGRTICYDNGMKVTYFRGGKYANSLFGEGTWRIDSAGIHIKTGSLDETLVVDIQPDNSVSLPTVRLTGKDCK